MFLTKLFNVLAIHFIVQLCLNFMVKCFEYCYQCVQIIEFTSRYAFKVLHTPGHTMESVVYLPIEKLNIMTTNRLRYACMFVGSY